MKSRLVIILIICCSVHYFGGCAFQSRNVKEQTLKEKAMDEILYISTSEQRNTLKGLQTDEEINLFLDNFWKKLDPTPGTPENELKNEYRKRLEYVKQNYPDRRSWGRSDQGRVYLLNGPPDQIERNPWESLEIWIYDRPTRGAEFPNVFSNIHPAGMKFIFADLSGCGWYRQIYSSETGENIDPRLILSDF